MPQKYKDKHTNV